MNSMQIKDKLKNIAVKRNLDFNTLLRLHMYDRFIERLAISEYRDNFILKGGFYLSTLFGLENQSTKDIDTAIKDANFSKKNVEDMIKSIISIDINRNAIVEKRDSLTNFEWYFSKLIMILYKDKSFMFSYKFEDYVDWVYEYHLYLKEDIYSICIR